MAHYEMIDDEVGDAGLFVVLYIMSIIWGMYISHYLFIIRYIHRYLFIIATGHQTYSCLFLG